MTPTRSYAAHHYGDALGAGRQSRPAPNLHCSPLTPVTAHSSDPLRRRQSNPTAVIRLRQLLARTARAVRRLSQARVTQHNSGPSMRHHAQRLRTIVAQTALAVMRHVGRADLPEHTAPANQEGPYTAHEVSPVPSRAALLSLPVAQHQVRPQWVMPAYSEPAMQLLLVPSGRGLWLPTATGSSLTLGLPWPHSSVARWCARVTASHPSSPHGSVVWKLPSARYSSGARPTFTAGMRQLRRGQLYAVTAPWPPLATQTQPYPILRRTQSAWDILLNQPADSARTLPGDSRAGAEIVLSGSLSADSMPHRTSEAFSLAAARQSANPVQLWTSAAPAVSFGQKTRLSWHGEGLASTVTGEPLAIHSVCTTRRTRPGADTGLSGAVEPTDMSRHRPRTCETMVAHRHRTSSRLRSTKRLLNRLFEAIRQRRSRTALTSVRLSGQPPTSTCLRSSLPSPLQPATPGAPSDLRVACSSAGLGNEQRVGVADGPLLSFSAAPRWFGMRIAAPLGAEAAAASLFILTGLTNYYRLCTPHSECRRWLLLGSSTLPTLSSPTEGLTP
ncbi:hypothetical protein FHS40_008732 [Streptomyces spectabilis]|uniref:Uncharacterized protein n=1 Tax=Streptomyces spectabilis TaxID=68270 RepID=A0A7W8EZW1_STRST|nr:hypothetical protein [Streptomyces spectabilis]